MQVGTRYITLKEYLSYGDQPVEVVNGEVIMTAAAHTRRQPNVVTNLFGALHPYVRKNRLGKVFTEASYVLDGDPRSNWVVGARTPDLSFITRERIDAHNAAHPSLDEPWWLAPDLAVEIFSPTDSHTEVSQKVADYLSYGVRLVWVIEPAVSSVRVYSPDEPLGHTLGDKDKLTAAPLIEGWSMKVADLFSED
jgi:Uma2 family endonuclease